MAIDFDALDLVRTKNKAKMYEQKKREQLLKRVDDIKQKLLKPIFNGCNDEFYEMWLNKAHKYYNDTLFKKQKGKNKMEYKFNEDQIFIIKWCLEIQESIWSKSKSSREYYDADLSRLNECLKIIANKIQKGKIK